MKLFRTKQNLKDIHEQAEYWNGYEREKAVKRLGEIGSSSSIPILLRRANDWVPQVRNAAKESLLKLCVQQNAEAFTNQLPNVFHLKNCNRANHDELISKIVTFLITQDNRKFILKNICNSDRDIARICLKISIKNNLETHENLIGLAFEHQDAIVRSIAFELFKPNLKKVPKSLINKARNDSFMPIRRETLRVIWENSRDIEATYFFLFDRHASVRSLSVRFLEEAGEKDNVIDGYISELLSYNSIQKSRCAIWAIGHLALEEHHNHARTHLFSNYPSIRKQALLTLVKFRVSDIGSILKECLYDHSPSVRKLSLRLHKDLEISYSVNDLLSLVQNTTDHKCRESCFDVARLSNRWDRLIFLVSLLDPKYADLFSNELIIQSIKDWGVDSNRVASSPDKNQMLHLRELLKSNPNILNLDKTMPFILKTFGIIDIP